MSQEPAQNPTLDSVPSDPKAVRMYQVANVTAYVLNAIVTYVSISGVFGETNSALSKKYQTLVTPSGAAFSIWGPIFIWEFVFVVAQLTPYLRDSALVPVVTPWWCLACAFQILWSLFFAQDLGVLALICMLGIFASLWVLMLSADKLAKTSISEFWLLRAPFSLHAGWITVASVLNISVYADNLKANPEVLLALATASLAVVFAIAAAQVIASPRPDAIICFVFAWATFWISQELKDPEALLSTTRFNPFAWEPIVYKGFGMASLLLCFGSLALALVAVVLRLRALKQQCDVDTKTEETAEQTATEC